MPKKKVTQVEFVPALTANTDAAPQKRKVAAYARVSTSSEEQETSLSAQREYYEDLIRNNAAWEFAGIYYDDGLSGLSYRNRDGFNHMISDALDGKIDLIITKSISRFARNTVDTLVTIRKLKDAGIEVYFEKEHIHTLDAAGEFLITLMSSLAQEESRSISENVTWGQRKRFSDGKYSAPYSRFLGYDRGKDGYPAVNKKEAQIVKLVYRLWLLGESDGAICGYLERHQIPAPGGQEQWSGTTILSILTNEKYKGDALLQKSFTVDFLSKRTKKNEGEITQYYVENGHEAIVSSAVFDMVQEEIRRRAALCRRYSCTSPLSARIICGVCGAFYGAKTAHTHGKYEYEFWRCAGFYDGGKHAPTVKHETVQTACRVAIKEIIAARPQIINHCAKLLSHLRGEKTPQKVIEEFLESNQTLWDDEWLLRTLISRIYVMPNGKLKIFFIDGTVSRFDMNRQKRSAREKTPTPIPPLPPRKNMPLQPHEPGQRLSDDIKDEICYLRLQGIGYKRIAAELGLSKNTVSSFCTRHNLGGSRNADGTVQHPCRYCGKSVPQAPHRREKFYCSGKCRCAYFYEQKKKAAAKDGDNDSD